MTLLWSIFVGIFIIIIMFGATIMYVWCKKKTYSNLFGKHVVITGGSSGIGKAAACEAARQGAHVTIIGRDVNKLEEATKEVLKKCPARDKQIIHYTALDVTADYKVIQECLADLETKVGPIFMLVNCAGACICGLFEEMKVESIKQMINLNYFGTALPTRAVLPGMRKRDEGIVVFVASEAAMIGIYGYSAYSAGKWAVRGLAEAIGMELVGTNVRVMLSYPPDTDTPGLKQENTTKPLETKIISESGGLHSPEEVGKKLVQDAMEGKTYSTYSLSGAMLNILSGLSLESCTYILIQFFFMGAIRCLLAGLTVSFHKVVSDHWKVKKARLARQAFLDEQNAQTAK